MAKINDLLAYPITTPTLSDRLIATDVSNTSNDSNGETVQMTVQGILQTGIIDSAAAPTITPVYIGQFYIDTTSKKAYIAFANDSAGSFIELLTAASGSTLATLSSLDSADQMLVFDASDSDTPKSSTLTQVRDGMLAVASITSGVAGADRIVNTISLSQAEYDAIGSKDSSTLYVITG